MECPLGRAIQGALAILTKVRPNDLDGPTPCASWDVRALVNHFVDTARWWAANISGEVVPPPPPHQSPPPPPAPPPPPRPPLLTARLAITDAYRGPDGQALFGPAREAPAGAGPADQLAAFLGRAV